MRTQGVMLSVRLSDECMTELKRVEKDCFGYTRSKLVKEALQLLFDKFPNRAAALNELNMHVGPNGTPVLGKPATKKVTVKVRPKKKPKK